MTIIQEHDNPYIIGSPVVKRQDFIGREQVFHALNLELNIGLPQEPLFLVGPKGIGKTSLLKQLEAGRLKPEIFPVFVDVRALPLDELTRFLWTLAKITMDSLVKRGIDAPALEKRNLILRPWEAFNRYFWQLLPSSTNGRLILFILDNFDELVTGKGNLGPQYDYRQKLFTLFDGNKKLAVLLSLTGRAEAFSPDNLTPFHQAKSYRLKSFSRKETEKLIRQPGCMVVFNEVIEFIYRLTTGHPGDVQRLCHSLYERYLSRGLSQLTMFDVVSTLESDLSPKDFCTTVYRRLAEIAVWKRTTN